MSPPSIWDTPAAPAAPAPKKKSAWDMDLPTAPATPVNAITVPATAPKPPTVCPANSHGAPDAGSGLAGDGKAEAAPVQPPAPIGNRPQNTSDDKVGVAGVIGIGETNPGKAAGAPSNLDATLEMLATGFHALAQGMNEKLGMIGTILAGFRTIIEQSAVTNVAALSDLEERVRALESALKKEKPARKGKDKAAPEPEPVPATPAEGN